MGYESLFYQFLTASDPAADLRKLPLVVFIVAFSIGEVNSSAETCRPQFSYWLVDDAAYSRAELAALTGPMADLLRIKKSLDWWEVRLSVHRLRRSIPLAEASLRRGFETWLQKAILPRFGLSQEEVSATLTLEELETMLVLRQLRLKFGPLEPEIEDQVRSADADRLLEWGERVLTAENLQDIFRD